MKELKTAKGKSKTATKKTHKCKTCGKKFQRLEHLKCHTRVHTGDKPYKCDICFVRFRNCSNLKEHRRIHTGEYPYDCRFCGLTFLQINHLNKHQKTCTTDNPKSPSAKLLEQKRKQYSTVDDESTADGILKCFYCPRTFGFRFHYHKHMRSHFGGSVNRCELCGTGFSTTTDYDEHKKDHSKEPSLRYQCHICGMVFDLFYALDVHVNSHAGKKLYRCDYCGKAYSTKSKFKEHITSHKLESFHEDEKSIDGSESSALSSDEMPVAASSLNGEVGKATVKHEGFTCPYCNQQFTSKQCFDKHIDWHHSDAANDTSYPSPEKQKSTATKNASRQASSSTVKLFLTPSLDGTKVITSGKSFECTICNRHFTRQHYYTVHMRVHTGTDQEI